MSIVTSKRLTVCKRKIIRELGDRLVGVAVVPTVPAQVGYWRHLSGLALYAGVRGVFQMMIEAIVWRVPLVFEALGQKARSYTVRGLARKLGLPFFEVRSIKDPGLQSWLSELQCDLVVSMHSHQVGKELLEIPRLGWLNLHHGRLPDYRGVFSIFWAMAREEREIYVTAHLMGSQLDRGPIVVEEAIPVPTGATVEDVENVAWGRSADVVLRAVSRLEKDPAALRPPRRGGHFYSYPSLGDLAAASRTGLRLR